ncbi:MAG TPA: T9SS type A sorting domain-containing protein [Chitinophagaceae bacterium]|nr:T9SS type A sorting domain-containing protein [Chitinophagaceae bacterium]
MKRNLPKSALFLLLPMITLVAVLAIKKLARTTKDAEQLDTEYFNDWARREAKLLGCPGTYIIPRDARMLEMKASERVPLRGIFARGENVNTYISAGPGNFGGRSRVVEYDKRYNGSTNQVVLAGGVNGGVFKSTDGGNTWAWKATVGYNSVTTLAQDPRGNSINPITNKPYSDTWYLGTGEFQPSSYAPGALIPGYGMYISDDNGDTWQPMAFSQGTAVGSPPNNIHDFESLYDMINKIVVDPVSGVLYVSRYGQLLKITRTAADPSLNTSFSRSITFTAPNVNILSIIDQISDVVVRQINSTTTKVYLAFYGTPTDTASWTSTTTLLKGVWESSTGDQNTWVKVADASIYPAWRSASKQGRMVMALTPDQNALYVLAENQIDVTNKVSPEADLYKINLAVGSPGSYPFTNLSANLPTGTGGQNFRGLQVQGGYDLAIAIKPDNANFIFIGGTNAYRSTDGFSTVANVNSIGGYQYTNVAGFAYPNTHPDVHWFSFQPGNPNIMLLATDGGVSKTTDVTLSSPSYTQNNTNFQTYQYYYVAIDPVIGQNTFIGGAQDNSCTMRNNFNASPDNHFSFLEIIGGDGGAVGITNITGGKKYLFLGVNNGTLRRAEISTTDNSYISNGAINSNIKPSGSSSDLITYFYLNPDNSEHLYYTGYTGSSPSQTPKLYRTTAASTVTSAGWTDLTGVSSVVGTGRLISSLATTRGTYNANHNLFIGTDDGRILRIKDPANVAASASPTNISPSSTFGGNFIDISVNPRNDDTLIAVVSNYKYQSGVDINGNPIFSDMPSIWFTGNANAVTPTWTQIQGNIAPFSIRSCEIVVKQAGVEYYVGTSIGLYSTTAINGVATLWVKEGASTPMENAIVSSLAHRPGDNTFLVGTHGNGMFYTNIGNVATGVEDPIRNDKRFIELIWPTVVKNNINIRKGSLTGIRKLDIQVFAANGQLLLKRTEGYSDLTVDVSRLAAGSYFISIASSDYKYQTVQQFVKN